MALVSGYFFWKGYATHRHVLEKPVTIRSTERIPENYAKTETQAEIEEEVLAERSDFAPQTAPEVAVVKQVKELDTSPAAVPDNTAEPQLVLKAKIREETWVRIFVDDQDPKEYILRPKENIEWRAKNGFELLIGNAAGMDIELNGEEITDVGTPGQVVRLNLPKGYKRRHLQE
jgi:hypothetical protein